MKCISFDNIVDSVFGLKTAIFTCWLGIFNFYIAYTIKDNADKYIIGIV